MENVETNTENIWQVETGGQIYDTNLEEMTTWIAQGSLLRIDRVRKGNLRWIEAGKVPPLVEFFNAKDAEQPDGPIVTETYTEVLGVTEPTTVLTQLFTNPLPWETPTPSDKCSMHPEAPAAYVCDTCKNSFCKTCPANYGTNVKICPFCGAMCRWLPQAPEPWRPIQQNRPVVDDGFGFSDFGNALAYPFKFKFSLVVGAIMFAFFSLGQSAVSFGGIFMMASAILCFLLANMLSFGVLATTVENFTQGKLDQNFMPSFEDFSIWDDVVHPFFLSIGVYISSFGPFIAVMLVAVFLMIGSASKEINGIQSDAARTINPEIPYIANTAKQSQAVRDLVKKTQDAQKRRVEQMEKGAIEGSEPPAPAVGTNAAPNSAPGPNANAVGSTQKAVDPDQAEVDRVNQMIQDQRKAQLESAIGKTPETKAKEQQALVQKLLGYGVLFLLFGGITLLWGLFYFPAACAVAGYTRSFAATLTPSVGFDTIKRLGGSYALILLMGLFLLVVSVIVSFVFNAAFSAFDLPAVGNVPAKFLGSMFAFYISVVFSCILGYALYKKADVLELPS